MLAINLAKEPTATDLTRQALEFLLFNGCFAWRQNNFGKLGRAGVAKKGVPDIIGITRDGRFVGLEIKVGKDRQSEDQKGFEKQIKEKGGVYAVIKQFDDLEGLEL